jgi:peptidoglycan hydrolase CwlO-like protein
VIRTLYILNLLGIVVLAVLCVAQWRRSSRDDRLFKSLEQTRLEQSVRLDKQAAQLTGAATDQEELRHRLTEAQAELRETHGQLDASTAERDRLQGECQQLQAGLRQWTAAIATRDQALEKASRDIQELAGTRNQAVTKFNDLVARYDTLVREINQATTRPTTATAPTSP